MPGYGCMYLIPGYTMIEALKIPRVAPSCRFCVCSPHYTSAAITNKYASSHSGPDRARRRRDKDL